jgi:uncharacterized repeat protein (TIGR03803 family)
MKNLKMQLAVVLLSTLCLFTGAYGQVIPSGDAATLNEEHASSAPQLTYTMLHSFDNTDGEQPEAALVQATNGSLYGTTSAGGANGGGTIFKITPRGKLTTVYNFCSQTNCADGQNANALVQATDGNFYGTTISGGDNGGGTVFRFSRGKLTTLYNFCSQTNCADGSTPFEALIQATDGNFYGTTFAGGANGTCTSFGFVGCGTIFKITPSGRLTTLYSFCSQSGCTDGESPNGLIQATDGNFYGVADAGGANNETFCSNLGANGCGTVFQITPRGKLTTVYNFCSQNNCADGQSANALIQATDGNFYGTTFYGGASGNGGTVFRITRRGTLTTLYSFSDADGIFPDAGLVQATDGNLYGTTEIAGANGHGGTIFKITPTTGTLTTIYNFCSQSDCTDGYGPAAALVQDTNGNLYGSTFAGGAGSSCNAGCGDGTVFSLSIGLGQFVETQTTSGKVGDAVKILGTDLTEATSVTFNGTPAVFKVVSRSLIKTWVPRGATTGEVEVTTPHGTLRSNVPFRVVDLP